MLYEKFCNNKKFKEIKTGLIKVPKLNKYLFPFEKDIIAWALKRGRACVFAGCGLGKTFIQLEWAHHIPGDVLIATPLAVTFQTINEAEKFEIEVVKYSNNGKKRGHLTITNYENLHKFNPKDYKGIVLDESSIIKNYTSKYRNNLIENWTSVPFRLACSATPAPNDYMELGNHAEFMGIMTRIEMLSMFFIHDGGETVKWRLKGHGKTKFFEWVASWAVMLTSPSDLGYVDGNFILPKLHMHEIVLPSKVEPGRLLPKVASTLQERQQARRETIDARAQLAADIANKTKGHILLWGNLNKECDAIEKKTNDCIQVAGADKPDEKVRKMNLFTNGKVKAMVSKPKIAGWGMNWQHCHTIVFVGLSDSFEQTYQAIRRCYRFGQKEEVHCYWITSYAEGNVVQNIKRKEKQAEQMQLEMIKYMHQINEKNIKRITKETTLYNPNSEMKLPTFIKGEINA